jgi:hypothetical protein
MPDDGVASREQQSHVSVVGPANEVRRTSAFTVHFEDFSVSVWLTDAMALDDDPVSDAGFQRVHRMLLVRSCNYVVRWDRWAALLAW